MPGWDLRQIAQRNETLSNQHIFNSLDFPPLQDVKDHMLSMKGRRRSRSSAEARPAGLLSESERHRGARRSISTNPFSLKKVVCASSMRRSTGGIPESRLSLTGAGGGSGGCGGGCGGGGSGVARGAPIQKLATPPSEEEADCPPWPDQALGKAATQVAPPSANEGHHQPGLDSPLENATPLSTQPLQQRSATRSQDGDVDVGSASGGSVAAMAAAEAAAAPAFSSAGGSTSPSDPEDGGTLQDADSNNNKSDDEEDKLTVTDVGSVKEDGHDQGQGQDHHSKDCDVEKLDKNDHLDNDETKDNVSSDSLEELCAKSGTNNSEDAPNTKLQLQLQLQEEDHDDEGHGGEAGELEGETEGEAQGQGQGQGQGESEDEACQPHENSIAASPRQGSPGGPRLLGAETLYTPQQQSEERRRATRSLFAEDFLEWLEERPAMLRIGAFSGKGWDNPLSNFDKRELVILNLASENLAQRDRILELEEELRCAYATQDE